MPAVRLGRYVDSDEVQTVQVCLIYAEFLAHLPRRALSRRFQGVQRAAREGPFLL